MVTAEAFVSVSRYGEKGTIVAQILQGGVMRGINRFRASALVCLVVGLSVFGQSQESLMSSGNALLQNGAYDQAATKFRTVLTRDPGNLEARFNLGLAYLNMGKMNEAITEFKQAIGVNPQCTECWGNLAIAYENLGRSDKALGALHQAVNNNPGNIEARINLATMYANANQLNNAIAQYKEVIQIDGNNVDAHLNLAKCLISKGDESEARHYLKSAIALNPSEAEAYWELGNIAWHTDKKPAEAIQSYRKAVALQPNSQVYYENLGLALESQNKKQEAIDVWRKYLIYLDDALKKEKINDRIAMLERGESPSGKESPEKLFGKSDNSEGISRLQQELRSEEESSSETKLITTESMNVSDELKDLDQDSDDAFEFDMKKAVRDKKKSD